MGDATADPVGSTDRTLAGTAETFLTPRLTTTTTNLSPGFGRSRTGALASQLRSDDLMKDIQVWLDAKDGGIELHVTR